MTAWIPVCSAGEMEIDDVLRFDHEARTYAIYLTEDGVYASDGLCTHEKVHLCDGLVMDGVIECPKHNGRFDIKTGKVLGGPVCVNLKTYPAKIESGVIHVLV